MSTSRTAQRPSSVAYLPRSHRSPLSARTRAEAILPALALTLTYFKKLTLGGNGYAYVLAATIP